MTRDAIRGRKKKGVARDLYLRTILERKVSFTNSLMNEEADTRKKNKLEGKDKLVHPLLKARMISRHRECREQRLSPILPNLQ